MDSIVNRLLNDECSDTPELRREAAAEIVRLQEEMKIGADRLAIAAGVCKEWSDRLRVFGITEGE